MKPTLSISVLQLNHWPVTLRCLESLVANTSVPTEILVFENGSQDGSSEKLLAWVYASLGRRPNIVRITVTTNPKNIGFIEAHNAQVKKANGRWVCLLNNDVVVLPGWDSELLGMFATNHRLGAVGPRWRYGFLNSEMCGGPGPATKPVEYIEGFCVVMPTRLARVFGPFDGSLLKWATGEDSDLSLRIRQSGWEIDTIVTNRVEHVGRATMEHVSSEVLGYDPATNELQNRAALMGRWAEYIRHGELRGGRKILVRRTSAHGDVLCAEPIIRGLRNKYPTSHITFQSSFPWLGTIAACPLIDRMTTVQEEVTKVDAFDEIIDLDDAYESRPLLHIVEAYAQVARVEPSRPRWYLDKEGHRMAECLPAERPICVIAPEVGWPMRQWPVERFREVAERLSKLFQIAVVGSLHAPHLNVGWDLRGRTSLQQLAGLYSKAALVVTLDSLHVHLAACFSTPTVGIWGGTGPQYRIHGPEHIAVTRDGFECKACHHDLLPPRHQSFCDQGKFRGLAVPENGCMDISVEAVMNAAACLVAT